MIASNMEYFFFDTSTLFEAMLKISFIFLLILNPLITSNPENKSFVIEVTLSKFSEYSVFCIISFLDKAFGITNPKIPHTEIKITILGLIINKKTRDIAKDITHDIT